MKAENLQELRKEKKIKVDSIKKVMSKQTYYNWINWVTKPEWKVLDNFLNLFQIDKKTFDRLLKNTLKKN